MPAFRLLVVDDEAAVRDECARGLAARGLDLAFAASPDEAERLLRDREWDCILCDMRLRAPRDGVDVLTLARGLRPATRRVLMSGFPDPMRLFAAQEAGVLHEFVDKPVTAREFAAVVDGFTMKAPPPPLGLRR